MLVKVDGVRTDGVNRKHAGLRFVVAIAQLDRLYDWVRGGSEQAGPYSPGPAA